jgi:glucose/mannose-6-phosphate isomerase
VIDLDDPGAVAAADPSGILRAILGLGNQCRRGYLIGRSHELLPDGSGVASIVLCGMGGSGVGGDVIRALYRDRLGVPVDVVKDVTIPEHCSPSSLMVCSSFSGDTSETLSCFAQALDRGCRLIAVCSGGELRTRAEAAGVPVLLMPGGPPAPRTALGLLLLATLGALEAMGVIPALDDEVAAAAEVLDRMAASVGPDEAERGNDAKRLARLIGDRIPVIWGAEGIGSVAAARWRTEFQENAKVPAFASSFPELDHNEIVPWGERWRNAGGAFALLTLRHEGEHPDVAGRIRGSETVASEGGLEAIEVWAEGDSPLSRVLSLVLLGGAASVYLGLLRGVDPAPIPAIDRLKRERAERST